MNRTDSQYGTPQGKKLYLLMLFDHRIFNVFFGAVGF
jgi:hypothetical protein